MSLDRLHSFVRVANAGSIARAAGPDPVRQSQFSRQIGELEEFFGLRLTRRQGRSLVLTSEGIRLATLIREHLGGLQDFLRSSAQQPVEINIGAGDSLITWLLLPQLPAFQRRFPRALVRIHNLRSLDIVRQLDELQLDFGIVRADTLRPPLKHSRLGTVEFRLFVPAAMRKKADQLTPTEMLTRLPIATLGSDTAFFNQLTDDVQRRRIGLNLKLITETFPQAAKAVLTGQYAAILPAHAAVDLLPARVTSHELPLLRRANRAISLAWNPRLARTRLDADELRAELRTLLKIPNPT